MELVSHYLVTYLGLGWLPRTTHYQWNRLTLSRTYLCTHPGIRRARYKNHIKRQDLQVTNRWKWVCSKAQDNTLLHYSELWLKLQTKGHYEGHYTVYYEELKMWKVEKNTKPDNTSTKKLVGAWGERDLERQEQVWRRECGAGGERYTEKQSGHPILAFTMLHVLPEAHCPLTVGLCERAVHSLARSYYPAAPTRRLRKKPGACGWAESTGRGTEIIPWYTHQSLWRGWSSCWVVHTGI